MKTTCLLLTFALISTIILSLVSYQLSQNKSNDENEEINYAKLSSSTIKNYISNKDIYIIDTRDNTVSNLGYIKNSLLLPLTMDYDTWFPIVTKDPSNIVLICDESNYEEALEKTEALGPSEIIGYAIYDEIIKENELEIQVAEYNENTKEDVEKLVENGDYLLDVRRVSEYENTGIIEGSHLIPLNNFQTDYVQIPNDVDVYIFCGGGGRALLATTFLKRAGYTNRIVVMRGGMTKTIKEGYTLVPYTG